MSRADDKALAFQKKYGQNSAATGNFVRPTDVIPTSILALDYALGTGGWPMGSLIEVFGSPDLGKTTSLGYGAIREAQALGKFCGLVAAEPGYDSAWASKNGVDLDELLVTWPNDGKEAFDQMQDMILDPDVELIVFDSIGSLLRPSEAEVKGNVSAGGQAALITWGIKRASIPAFKLNKCIIFLNQIRDIMNSPHGGFDSPGGHALKHHCEIRVQLKPGTERYQENIDGTKVTIGRQLVAEVKRTKRDEGTGKRAVFDFYSKEFEGYPFGLDQVQDVINTGKRAGVIVQAGASYRHPSFGEKALMGKDAVGKFLTENPGSYKQIRNEILEKIR